MADTTIKKVEAGSSPRGEMGQKYLVAGGVSRCAFGSMSLVGAQRPNIEGLRDGRVCNLGKCKARSGRPDPEPKSRRELLGWCRQEQPTNT